MNLLMLVTATYLRKCWERHESAFFNEDRALFVNCNLYIVNRQNTFDGNKTVQ